MRMKMPFGILRLMKRWLLCLIAAALLAGCSKEEERSEQLGKDMADQMQEPLEKARAVYEKARKVRDVEVPQQ